MEVSVKFFFELLSEDRVQKVHDASLEVLSKTGMKIDSESLLDGLQMKGASVERNAKVVRFPERLVEESIENQRRLLRDGKKLHLLNGVTSEVTEENRIAAKMSGGCEKYFDWETHSIREATAQELLRYIRIGEKVPEVNFVGNPIVMRRDLNGNRIDERLRRIKTAALIAKNTRKIGSMEVSDEREIDLLVEIGIIARGGKPQYFSNPCLLTAKETISPLFLDKHSGDILLALAKRGLPCTVIPMPITGISAPVSRLGNIIVGNAEILGVMTAIHSLCPESPVGGGSITGIMDMQTGVVSFSAPEAILQDIAISEVHRKLYGFNYLVGSGYFDAKYPNPQVLAEKTMKYMFTNLSGRYSYPVGLIHSGSVFCIEQAMVDLEICRYIHGHFADIDDFQRVHEIVELIDRVGIRGIYIAEDHTLRHFKNNWFPRIMDRTSFFSFEESEKKNIYIRGRERVEKLLSAGDFWEIDRDRAKEIDAVVEKAGNML
jgi:trimethylamine--corrinoid protein Co-methyltransferase